MHTNKAIRRRHMNYYKSLKDYVFEYISEQINSGTIKPGEKVNESNIANALNVSRTPVREALIQLSDEGILDKIPRKGFVVREVTLNKVKEIYSIIGVLEGFAASLAVSKITEIEIDQMESLIKQMDRCIEANDYKSYYKLQLQFHEIFINSSKNSELIGLIDMLKRKFIKQDYISEEKNENLMTAIVETNNEHKEILNLFKLQDKGNIEKYIRQVHWNEKHAKYDSF
jgi:DNA-binding GntR family transcriptional regulator